MGEWCIYEYVHCSPGGLYMPLRYKLDVLQALKECGYNTTKLRYEKILSESTVQKLRDKKPINWDNISRICAMLNCQPGYFIEFVPDEPEPNPGEEDNPQE